MSLRKCPFKLLGVAPGCSEKELKVAFRRAALASHPDVKGGCAIRFNEVKQAFEEAKTPRLTPKGAAMVQDMKRQQHRFQQDRKLVRQAMASMFGFCTLLVIALGITHSTTMRGSAYFRSLDDE